MFLFQNESKRENLCYENEFDLRESEPVGGTHFHMNGFALRLVLKRRQKGQNYKIARNCLVCMLL